MLPVIPRYPKITTVHRAPKNAFVLVYLRVKILLDCWILYWKNIIPPGRGTMENMPPKDQTLSPEGGQMMLPEACRAKGGIGIKGFKEGRLGFSQQSDNTIIIIK